MGISVTADEADRKREGLREERKAVAKRGGHGAIDEMASRTLELDPTAIANPDPTKAYRLVNRTARSGERIARMKGFGYKITDPEAKTQLIQSTEQDGGQCQGDLVLMETPIENYERRRSDKRRRYDAATGAVAEQARDNINKIAREAGIGKPHRDASFDESTEA